MEFTSITKIKIDDLATKATSFPAMCYPDKTMEMQYKAKYIEGAKAYQKELLSILKEYFDKVTPRTTEENSEIRIEDKTLWELYNAILYSTH